MLKYSPDKRIWQRNCHSAPQCTQLNCDCHILKSIEKLIPVSRYQFLLLWYCMLTFNDWHSDSSLAYMISSSKSEPIVKYSLLANIIICKIKWNYKICSPWGLSSQYLSAIIDRWFRHESSRTQSNHLIRSINHFVIPFVCAIQFCNHSEVNWTLWSAIRPII